MTHTFQDLRGQGYTVDEGKGFAAVRGNGVATMIATGDQAAIDSLYNAVANPVPPPDPLPPGPDVAVLSLQMAQAVISAADFPEAQKNLAALAGKMVVSDIGGKV